jgi:hypothetical protein
MLELRPNCELCDRDLPPTSADARICTYECTFCRECVETVLHDVCPNCGGNFAPRPIRPRSEHRPRTSLLHHPPGTQRRLAKRTHEEIAVLASKLRGVDPSER